MRDLWTRFETEELPPLSAVLEEAQKQRAGPPLDPRAAAYELVLTLARGELYRATKKARRKLVLERFESEIQRIEGAVTGCESLGDQLSALHSLVDATRLSDRRKEPRQRGPKDHELLDEYEEIRPVIHRLWKQEAVFAKRVQRLQTAFPGLSDERAGEAYYQKPSRAAYEVLGERHGLSASQVQARCTQARKQRKER